MASKPKRNHRIALASLPVAEVAAALAEDVMVKSILQDARRLTPPTMATMDSVSESSAFMAKMRHASVKALRFSIKRKELLTEEELVTAIGSRQWVSYAIKTGRLFSVLTPVGTPYFPAFFVGSLAHRRLFGNVTQALAGLPGESMLHFFVSSSTVLGTTPAKALAAGRLKEVMVAAIGFASR